jgi:protein PsiE
MKKLNLHWTTIVTEKVMLAVIGSLTVVAAGVDIYEMFLARKIELADLFMLFIYTEIIGMVGAFFANHRIPVSLPIIIAITALCRLIVLHSKDADPWVLIAEAGAILVLSAAAYIMSYKDKLSLEKKKIRKE